MRAARSRSLLIFGLILWLPSCCLRASSPSVTPSDLHRRASQVWNTSSGLPQDTVHQLLETRDSFLWMATEGGLVRFDGYDFAVFDKRSTPGVFTSDLVNGLFEDAGRNLWIATSAGLIERSGGSFHRYAAQDGLPSESVWATGQGKAGPDKTGRIWAATSAGLTRLDGGRFVPYPHTGSFDGRIPSPLKQAADGTLWAVAVDAITEILPDGQVKSEAIPASPVDAATGPDSALWIATAHGLSRVDKSGSVSAIAGPTGAGQAKIQCISWDTAGSLWLGTTTGLYVSSSPSATNPAWRHYGPAEGLAGENVSRLSVGTAGDLTIVTDVAVSEYKNGRFSATFEQSGFQGKELLSTLSDREGDLWLGSSSAGVAVLRRLPFATLGSREGLPTDPVRSLLTTGNEVWLGTAAGLTHVPPGTSLPKNPNLATFTTQQGLASDEILALGSAPHAGSLWVGTPDGLSYLDHGHAITLTASDGLPDDNIRSLLLARDATLWIGTSHGLARLPQADPAQADSIRTYTQADGLGSNVIGSLLEDADGSLWIGTLNGLGHLERDRIHTYRQPDGLTSTIVTALARDKGPLWVGTSGGGLFAFENGKVSAVGTSADYSAGRLPATIYAIVEDDSRHLWFSSTTGIYRIAESDLAALAHGKRALSQISMDHFDVADGLRLQDCASGGHPEAALGSDGLLWFATQKGASVVDTHETLHHAPPPVSIESVSVDDIALSRNDQRFSLPAGHARLDFHYVGISLASPSKVRYRYQLEHFDRDWIDAGTRRTAYYTNIPPGHYVFRVLASLNGNDWSASAASIEFSIAPHYYQTWWFYLLLLLPVALIVWQLYLYRLRQVELRFDAVLAERGRIAREIHDTLAQDIVGISVQLELVSRLMKLSVDKAMAQLQETRNLVRTSLEQARSSIWDLRSSNTGDLPSRVRDTARQLTQDSGIALRLDIGGTYRAFSPTIEDELLRIAQEAITNAVRHAQPGRIDVSLNYHAKGARLEVRDDGRGFSVNGNKSGPAGHYGIRGMHERAERAHATLEIKSSPGEGTTVVAEAPQG